MAVPTAPFQPGSFFFQPTPVHHQPNLFPPGQISSATNQWTSSPGLFPLPLGPPNFGGFINLSPSAPLYHHQPPRFHLSGRNHHPFNGRKGPQRGRNKPDTNRPAALACKSCSKEYRTDENYKLHLQSHEKCGTCDFEALPRVLKEHELVHLLPDELKFSTPEEIKKWRENRRKNYPTAANIARKAKLAAEKKARGEVAQTPLHRYINHLLGDGNNDRPFKGPRGRRGRGRRGRPYNNNHHQRPRPPRGSQRGNHRGGSLRGRIKGTGEINRSDMKDNAAANHEPNNTSAGSLPSVASKNRDTDSDIATGETVPSTSHTDIFSAIMADVSAAAVIHQTDEFGDCDCGRGHTTHQDCQDSMNECKPIIEKAAGSSECADVCEKQTVGQRRRKQPWVSRRENKKRKINCSSSNTVPSKKPTLLEKLLAPEIRHEQNTILQCIHYIIEKEFFDQDSSLTHAAGHKEIKDN